MIYVTSISGSFNRVSSDQENYYMVGSEGIVVIRKGDLKEVAYAALSGLRDVTSGSSRVFLASTSGILFFNKQPTWSGDFVNKIYYHSVFPDIVTNDVTCIDSSGDFTLFIGTPSGVTLVSGGEYFTSTETSGVNSVNISEDGSLYYGGSFGLASKISTVQDSWIADYILDENSIPPVYSVNSIDSIKDEDTRILGLATDQGVILIQEEKDNIESSSVIFLTLS